MNKSKKTKASSSWISLNMITLKNLWIN